MTFPAATASVVDVTPSVALDCGCGSSCSRCILADESFCVVVDAAVAGDGQRVAEFVTDMVSVNASHRSHIIALVDSPSIVATAACVVSSGVDAGDDDKGIPWSTGCGNGDFAGGFIVVVVACSLVKDGFLTGAFFGDGEFASATLSVAEGNAGCTLLEAADVFIGGRATGGALSVGAPAVAVRAAASVADVNTFGCRELTVAKR